jgi:hypothetical protein
MRADEYEADGFGKDQFVVTDGEGMKFVIDAREKVITLDSGEGCRVLLEKGNKITCDNGKLQAVLNGKKISVKNASKSLFDVLDTHIKNVSGMQTMGSLAQHIVSPGDKAKFTQDGADLGAILEA